MQNNMYEGENKSMSNSKLVLTMGIVIGIVFGVFFAGFVFKQSAPTVLFKEVGVNYSFEKTVNLLTDRINAKDDWHVTDVIDQQAEVAKYGGGKIGKVKIIKFCNAKLASTMLSADDRMYMSVKMPLSISVYEKSDGRVTIGLANGYVMARLFKGKAEGEIMEKVVTDMEDILSFVHFRYTIF